MSEHDDDRIDQAAIDFRLASRLGPYVLPYWRLALAAFALTLLFAATYSVAPYLLGRAVDDGIVAGDIHALWTIGAVLLGLECVSFVANFVQLYMLQLLGQSIMVDLRAALMRHLQHQSMQYFSGQPVGRLVTRVVNDVGTISELFSTGLVTVIGDCMAVLLAGGFMLWLDWRLALISFAVLPILVGLTWLLKAKLRLAFRDMRRLLARLNARLAETLNGMRVIHAMGSERRNLKQFLVANDEYLAAALDAVHWSGVYASTITILTGLSIAALLGFGGNMALTGSVSIGVFVSILTYAQRLYMPIRDIAEKYTLFQSAMAGAERIFGVLDSPVGVQDASELTVLPQPPLGELVFDHVTFSYPLSGNVKGKRSREPALHDVSFRIRSGERVAIVGHTGAGKSTVINLLGRFYDVSAGAVRVDGVDVRAVAQRELRQRIGVVHQDVFIFSGTILDNIRMGTPGIDDASAIAAAQAVGADRWITKLEDGYHQVMEERGATLSVGEKQLLSFARALAHNAPVLVLDEATSSVDPETEALLQAAMDKLCAGRTAVIIAHRLATVKHVDRIFVFHKSRLVEQGSWDELLAKGGVFQTLHNLQFAT